MQTHKSLDLAPGEPNPSLLALRTPSRFFQGVVGTTVERHNDWIGTQVLRRPITIHAGQGFRVPS